MTLRHVAVTGLILMCAAAHVGFGVALFRHANTPGAIGATPESWPEDSELLRAVDEATVLVFVHPHCPCAIATLRELSRLRLDAGRGFGLMILFVTPKDRPTGWERTTAWRIANRIDGARVMVDAGGAEAHRFGAMTSGHVIMYDDTGRLAYSGGVTPARAHEGDSAGRASILSFLRGESVERAASAVYGCPLFDSTSPGVSEGACCGEESA